MMKPNILPKNDGRTVVIGPCRLSYTHLFEKYTGPDGDESRAKYQTGILIPKSQKETVEALKGCIKAAYDQAITKYWGGINRRLTKHRMPTHCVMVRAKMMKPTRATFTSTLRQARNPA